MQGIGSGNEAVGLYNWTVATCTPHLPCRSANVSVLLDITLPGKTTEVHSMGNSGVYFMSYCS